MQCLPFLQPRGIHPLSLVFQRYPTCSFSSPILHKCKNELAFCLRVMSEFHTEQRPRPRKKDERGRKDFSPDRGGFSLTKLRPAPRTLPSQALTSTRVSASSNTVRNLLSQSPRNLHPTIGHPDISLLGVTAFPLTQVMSDDSGLPYTRFLSGWVSLKPAPKSPFTLPESHPAPWLEFSPPLAFGTEPISCYYPVPSGGPQQPCP